MPKHFASAIIRWRDHLDSQTGGLGGFDQSYTVSTMLFGCHRYLEAHGTEVSPEKERIDAIKAELEAWMAERGYSYMS
jgi:hypothetical protein